MSTGFSITVKPRSICIGKYDTIKASDVYFKLPFFSNKNIEKNITNYNGTFILVQINLKNIN